MMLVPNFALRKRRLIVMENLTAESSQIHAAYKRLIKNCFSNFRHRYLNKRLQKLTQSFTGVWFLTPAQKQRFSLCFTGHRSEKLPKTAEQLETLKLKLWEEIDKAIENGIDTFYFGACYGFDLMCAGIVESENE